MFYISKTLLISSFAASLTVVSASTLARSTHYEPSAPPVSAIDGSGAPVGGFGRLFPLFSGKTNEKNSYVDSKDVVHYLLEHPSHRIELLRLAEGMISDDDPLKGDMPLAHVFLGQFIDHDITLDTVTNFDSLAGDVPNARTPDLDLDCIYGDGREASPYLYSGPYLRVGSMTVNANDRLFNRYDLLRIPVPPNDQGVPIDKIDTIAVIGDPRNDENFAVSQIQAAFIAYHNRMVDRIIDRKVSDELRADESVSKPLKTVQELIVEPGKDVELVLEEVLQLKEFDVSEKVAQRKPSEFLSTQSQRVQSVKEYAQFAKENLTDNTLQNFGTILDLAAVQNQNDRDELRVKKLKIARFVEEVFEEAHDLTIHHYHRVIVEDFLPKIISGERVLDMMAKGRNFYFPTGFQPGGDKPFIPIEFSVAAYRFAHSQVPGRFKIRNGVSSALFRGGKGNMVGDLLPNGFTPIRTELTAEGADANTSSLVIDWSKLIDIRRDEPSKHESALKIDTLLSSPLETLDIPGITPGGGLSNLAARNLSRGRTYRLPSGQDLAGVILNKLNQQGSLAAYGFDAGGDIEDLILPPDDAISSTLITTETPLWYYIIQEASCFKVKEQPQKEYVPMSVQLAADKDFGTTKSCDGEGIVLGPVGGTIVGEVLWGLVDHYRVSTGSGIDLNVDLGYCTDCDMGERNPENTKQLTETIENGSRRYLLRNFLHDAGVAYILDSTVTVCEQQAHLPSAECPADL